MSKEREKVVTAGVDDVNSIRTFVKHFNLVISKPLEESLLAFEKDPTFENQEVVRKALAEFIVEESSGLMKDKMFAPLFNESYKVDYYSSFEEGLEELIETPIGEDEKS